MVCWSGRDSRAREMKFVSFRAHGRETFGVVREDRVVELGAGGAMPARSLNELLALDELARAHARQCAVLRRPPRGRRCR